MVKETTARSRQIKLIVAKLSDVTLSDPELIAAGFAGVEYCKGKIVEYLCTNNLTLAFQWIVQATIEQLKLVKRETNETTREPLDS
jgi:hypothetical protein